jgi:LemA protein
MTYSLLTWAVFAMLIFWSVGGYNRLMRMRAKGLEAMGALYRYMLRYDALVHAHLGADMNRDDSEWSDLQKALSTLNRACQGVRTSLLGDEAVRILALSYQVLQDEWSSLRESPDDLAGQRLPEGLQVEWERISQKVMRARNTYQQIATEYNLALQQFPANLLVRVAGFKAAGTL